MKNTQQSYLDMQRKSYDNEGQRWNLDNKDPVVGAYDAHERHSDYDTILFDGIETKEKIALEYGCGPARNLIRFQSRFKRIDGCDISQVVLDKAKTHLASVGLEDKSNLFITDGSNVQFADDESYDVVYSVICLQHICCHSIRQSIMKDIFRVLKPGGWFTAQMGFGGRPSSVQYFDNAYDASGTNGYLDVSIENESDLQEDLANIGFVNYRSFLRNPCSDLHKQWIWFAVRKP